LRLGFSVPARVFACLDPLDFFLDCSEPHFRATAQFIFLRAFPGLVLEIVSFLVGATPCLLFFGFTQRRQLRLV
jgi:hypothetical protein